VDTSSCGTPSHAAPEVLSQSRMTKQGDVYAFGIIAWELVAGEDPYPGMLAVQIILQVVQHGYRPPRPAACPDPLWALMQRCWATEAHDRCGCGRASGLCALLAPMLSSGRSRLAWLLGMVRHVEVSLDQQAPAGGVICWSWKKIKLR